MKTIWITLSIASLYGAVLKSSNSKDAIEHKDIEKSLVLIPKGTVHCCNMGDVEYIFSAFNFKQTVDSFYISRYEVSNKQYLAFLADIRSKDSQLYKTMLPDTQAWRFGISTFQAADPFVQYYFRHPAYGEYPLVGITYEQATQYCEWLTAQYMSVPKRKYKKVKFSLPTLAQWVYAAGDSRTFPVGNHLQNGKGQLRANFLQFDQGCIKRAEIGDSGKTQQVYLARQSFYKGNFADGGFITVPVNGYWPDPNGLHNMAGNVEEYVREKGYTKGGSWRDPGYYLQNVVEETYDSTNYTSAERGFRYVMEIVK